MASKARELHAEWQRHAASLPLTRVVEGALWARFKADIDSIFSARDAAFRARDAELKAHGAARAAIGGYAGTLTIEGMTFTVAQGGASCTYALSSPSASVGPGVAFGSAAR